MTAQHAAECERRLSKREVARIASSIASRYQPDPNMGVIERINSEYAHLLNGGKSLILRTHGDGTWDTIHWTAFRIVPSFAVMCICSLHCLRAC